MLSRRTAFANANTAIISNGSVIRVVPGSIPRKRAESVTPHWESEMMTALRNSSRQQVESVGNGREYRVKSDDVAEASALAMGSSLVHGSLLTT